MAGPARWDTESSVFDGTGLPPSRPPGECLLEAPLNNPILHMRGPHAAMRLTWSFT